MRGMIDPLLTRIDLVLDTDLAQVIDSLRSAAQSFGNGIPGPGRRIVIDDGSGQRTVTVVDRDGALLTVE
jgi:hypothetical protein